MGAIIDPHFSQRGRHGRLLSAIAHNPHDLGIGIDEDTAILLDGHRFEVIGAGAVTVIDVGAASHTNVPDVHEGDNLALYDVKLHLLPAGHGFDLDKHTPISGRAAQQEQPDRTEGARQTKRSR
jgi:cyanophycinase